MHQQFMLGGRVRRLAMCATVFGASLAAQTAHATLVVVDFSANALSTVPFNIDGVYLNLVSGAAGVTGSSTPGYDINPYYSGSTTATPVFRFLAPSTGGVVGAAAVASSLAAGSVVGAASTFITGVMNATQSAAGTYYFGLKFVNDSTAAVNYGYLVVQQTTGQPLAAGSARILGYAYENAGGSVTIPSAVPEPTSALMMAMGGLLAGAVVRRRLKARQAEA
jgi:hypothetical protein